MMTLEEWRDWRITSVAEERGDLALIGLHLIGEPMRVEGIPGLWTPLEEGVPGLRLTARAEEGIEVDGRPLDGTVDLQPDLTVVRFSPTWTAQATSQPGSDHLLAIWDSEADALNRYEGMSFYPYDPDWVIEAEYVQAEGGRKLDFAHKSDPEGRSRRHESPGDLRFVRDGREYVVSPFGSDDSLIVVFGDRTNGRDTYGMGRMVNVAFEAGGRAILDFNRAYLPPCAFSPHFNCPLPPARNRLPIEVTAGEREVLWRE